MRDHSILLRSASRYRFSGRALLIFAVSGLSVSAHPGHDLGAYGTAHVLTSPFHLAALAAVGILVWCAALLIRPRLGRRLLQIGGVAIISFSGLLWLAGV